VNHPSNRSFRFEVGASLLLALALLYPMSVAQTGRSESVANMAQANVKFARFAELAKREPASLTPSTNSLQKKFFAVRDFQGLMKLSKISRQVYVNQLRDTVLEISTLLNVETQFETGSRDKSLDVWMKLFGSENAEALTGVIASEDVPTTGRTCIYAGWVLKYAGRYCESPPKSKSCSASQVQCNPLVFGAGVCAAKGRSATDQCNRNKKYTSDIVKYIEANPNQWNTLKSSLDSYCAEGRQRSVCHIIQHRIAAIEPSVSGKLPELVEESHAAKLATDSVAVSGPPPITVTAVRKPVLNQAAKSENSGTETSNAQLSAATHEAAIDESQKEMGLQFNGSRKCIWSELMFDIRIERSVGEPILNYSEASGMACRGEMPSAAKLSAIRERARRSKEQVNSAVNVDKEVLRNWNSRAIENFEACVAYTSKQGGGVAPPTNAKIVELVHKSSDIQPGDHYETLFGLNDVEFASQLATRGLHLCSTFLNDSSQPQSQTNQQSGAAQ
jgi:hypothetical protein